MPVTPQKSTSLLGHPWLVPALHSCSWAGCAQPLAVMTDIQKQNKPLEILGEDEVLCRCQDPWNDVGHQADGNEGLSQQAGRVCWTPCNRTSYTARVWRFKKPPDTFFFWKILSVPSVWVATEMLIYSTSKRRSHVRIMKGPPRRNWKEKNKWQVTVWTGKARTGLESLRPCSPVACKTSLVFAWKQRALTLNSTWELHVLLQLSRLL